MCTSVMPLASGFLDRGHNFVDRAFKGVGVALLGRESAELAGEDTDVGVVDVAIEDVGGDVAVLSLPHGAGHDPERIEIVRAIERERVLLGDPLVPFDFLRDRLEVVG